MLTLSSSQRLLMDIMECLHRRFAPLNQHFEAGWTDSFVHLRCWHEHSTLLEAAQCGMPHGAGWYVLAVENGTPRQLLGDEEDVVNKFRFGNVRLRAMDVFEPRS